MRCRWSTTDVAIIGGGAAGCYAALNLHRAGVEHRHRLQGTCRQKRRLDLCRQPGASAAALLGNSEENARNTAEFLIKYHNQFLIDQNWARRCGQWIEKVYYPELEEAGLYFRRDDAGNVVTSPARSAASPRMCRAIPACRSWTCGASRSSERALRALRKRAVTALLRRADGSVCGVFALDYMRGEYVVVLARAVILATGYSDRLHARSTGTREMSGDGIAMAWRVGAASPTSKCSGGTPTTSPIRRRGSACRSIPIRCLARKSPRAWSTPRARSSSISSRTIRWPMAPTPCSSRRWRRRCMPGRARYDGGYFAGFDHCDANEVDAYTTYGKTFRQLGLRFPQDLVETAVTAHYRQGGIDVDTQTMRSSVPGLYVAGGLGGHSNGLIGLATYDGKVVADGVLGELDATCAGRAAAERKSMASSDRLERLLCARGILLASRSAQAERDNPRHDVGEGRCRERCRGTAIGAWPTSRASDSICCPAWGSSARPSLNYEWLDAIDADQHARRLRADHPFLARAQGKPRAVHAARFSRTDNADWLAANVMRQDRQRLPLRATPLRTAVLPARTSCARIISRWRGEHRCTRNVCDRAGRAAGWGRSSVTTRLRRAIRGLRSATR